jgi:hypothetical protein
VPSATYFSGGYFWPLSVSRLHRGGGQDDWWMTNRRGCRRKR